MRAISKPTFADLFLVFLAALFWASAFTAIKIAVVETGPYWLVTGRALIGFLILLPFCIYMGVQFPKDKGGWILLLVISTFNVIFPFLMISWAQQFVGAGVTAILLGSSPFFAMIVAHLMMNDEKITRYKVAGVTLGMAGVLTIVGSSAMLNVSNAPILPMLAIILSGLCYVISGTMMRHVEIKPVQFITLTLGIASIANITIAYLVEEGVPVELPSQKAMLAILWLGLFPTGLAYILRFMLVQKIGYSTFALGINLVPVLGVVIGAIVLNEPVTSTMVIALCLVLGGLFISRFSVQNS